MQDISVLTPPLLMCAAVLVAVGMFLRHEMNRKRPEEQDGPDDIPAEPPIPGQQVSDKPASSGPSGDDGDS
jgi:hypothetical protein